MKVSPFSDIAGPEGLCHHSEMKEDASALHKNILFVCPGNICRSPIAEGSFRHIAAQRSLDRQFTVDSAGLGSWHVGHPPDERAQAAMRARGIEISDLRGRRITAADSKNSTSSWRWTAPIATGC